VHAMPRQGVTSSFSFGRATGAAETLAILTGAGTSWVEPRVWKKHHMLGPDKRRSLALAAELWPFMLDKKLWGVLANEGIAEAALIARWFYDNLLASVDAQGGDGPG